MPLDDTKRAMLDPFVGEWETRGTMLAAAGTPGTPFAASDVYEWLPGTHFLIHRWDAGMPDGRVQGIEVIGFDEEGQGFFMHSYDSLGNVGRMNASYDGQTWEFSGGDARFRGRFEQGGDVFSGTWELCTEPGGAWEPWMSIELRKKVR